MCRYCFEGREAGELISPCKCAGGQKWVHLACLRRWQRGVLVSQPTHPDFYDSDQRHKTCNVCNSAYTCKPPTRLELMQSFTGAELAALVEVGCLIASSKGFSGELKRHVQGIPEHLHASIVDRHWIDGAFLIIRVTESTEGTVHLHLTDAGDASAFADDLSDDWCWQLQGRSYRLNFIGPLQAVASADRPTRIAAIKGLEVPCGAFLTLAEEADCGEDGILAVNLTNMFELSASSHALKRARYRKALTDVLATGEEELHTRIQVMHFLGGPCHEDRVHAAIISTDGDERYEQHETLRSALTAAQTRCRDLDQAGESCAPPQEQAAPAEAAQRAEDEPPQKRARTAEADGAATGSQGRRVTVKVFWGTAGWSRCQLMGEIASGSWGLCRSSPADVTSTAPNEIYDSVYPRLIFAPASEMSESFDQAVSVEELNRARLEQLVRHQQLLQQRDVLVDSLDNAVLRDAFLQSESSSDDLDEEVAEGEEEEDEEDADQEN
eukprot:TRINITY_DN81945_c0_g1_i1.p1 TRINITY_DN81945_c0_g1~~TRINITY_DN81945_c0_g1_i1.p1  ORF type:complete len:523 (+),score=99.44 TRINITY_DN81945_c0_g1_i1:84-1571(+)